LILKVGGGMNRGCENKLAHMACVRKPTREPGGRRPVSAPQLGAIGLVQVIDAVALEPFGEGGDVALPSGMLVPACCIAQRPEARDDVS
jgi:hypothetical protein